MAKKTNRRFDNRIDFKITLIPYVVDTSWIESKLLEIKEALNQDMPPDI
jgi:hypothetical protein|tara:strand:+ start:233 stop:379 length:147 start_codon:yes stop_codon:yes gene_type:complete